MSAVLKPRPCQVRLVRPDDFEAIFAIEQRVYTHPWGNGVFRDCVKAGYAIWVLERDDELIGYGVLSVGAGEAHVLNIAIAAEHQGQGHGSHLLRRLLDVARWHRAERVILEVRPSNPRAIDLYYRLGFSQIGQRRNYYPADHGREDAIVMALELVSPDFKEP